MKVNVPFGVFVVAALLTSPAAFACDATLEAQVAAKPDDTDARDALARSCARAGEHAEALTQYDALLARDAANVDWLLGKSQALIALGRPREALPLLDDARRRAPAYEDVWRANANVLDQLDEFDAADALLTQAAAQFPQSTWPRERQAALRERRLLERGMRLSADLSYEELSGDRPAWKGASLGVNRPLGEHRQASSPACTSKSASTPATSRRSSATPPGSATTGPTASPATSRPTRRSCPNGASPPMRAARCRTPGASASACATRATRPSTSTRSRPRSTSTSTRTASAIRSIPRRRPTSMTRASATCCASRANTATAAASRSSSASARKRRPSRPASCR